MEAAAVVVDQLIVDAPLMPIDKLGARCPYQQFVQQCLADNPGCIGSNQQCPFPGFRNHSYDDLLDRWGVVEEVVGHHVGRNLRTRMGQAVFRDQPVQLFPFLSG